MNTLYDFHYRPHLKAKTGNPAKGRIDRAKRERTHRKGAWHKPSAMLRRARSFADLTEIGAEVVVASVLARAVGATNTFATPTDRAPRRYEEGTEGEPGALS